jgi:geranylgeranyl pyrophosphate synthase
VTRGISLDQIKNEFDHAWQDHVASLYAETSVLHEACRYALLTPGKRIRPLLTLLWSEQIGAKRETALRAAFAIEMIHAYSLVHDDLPSMDNDMTRRGQPTVHVKFGEAMAILAGDALLTDAFRVLASADSDEMGFLVKTLAEAAGSQGMVLGQALDILAEKGELPQNADLLNQIHLNKTGKLIEASCKLGAGSSGCPRAENFGRALGIAFQIQDDLMDDLPTTGKTQGKDKVQGKLTFASFFTRDQAGKILSDLIKEATSAIGDGPASPALHELIARLVDRKK